MHILLTNHHLLTYQGSENFTLVIADYLIRHGHYVTFYSAYINKLRFELEKLGVEVVSDLSLLNHRNFDVAHVHHHINTYEIRYYFPTLPIVLLCHGIIFLENPPPIDLNISEYLATSERVRDFMVSKGIPKEKILIFRNMVDSEKFYPSSKINQRPSRALILSNKIDPATEMVIRESCKALNIESLFIGSRFRQVNYKQIPLLINDSDLVFSLGRGVIETMFCGRIPIIFDYEGGDGMVTSSTIHQNITCNFSGNLYNKHYSKEELIQVIKAYAAEDAIELRDNALKYFSAAIRIHDLIDIYRAHAKKRIEKITPLNQQILASFVQSVAETRAYTSHLFVTSHLPTTFHRYLYSFIRESKKKLNSFFSIKNY